jgi:hypothetical protein
VAHDVFISYSNADQPAALAVLHGLEAVGIRCWMAPRDIAPGAIWAQSIIEGINGCHLMVVVFSEHANRSSHVINEVDAAVRKGAIIVPLRIQDVMPDGAMEYHLRTRHWLDALTPDLENHTAQLAEQIKLLLATQTGGPLPTPPPRPMPPDLPPRRQAPPQPPAPIPPQHRPIPRGRLYAAAAVLVAVVATALIYSSRERPVGDVVFTIRENSGSGANQASLVVTTGTLRFFESGDPMPPNNQRQYGTTFSSGSARLIYPEVKLTSEAPGRVVSVPISCAIFGAGGAVSGAVVINGQIQPTWTETYNAHGYGNASGGSWKPGHYRADCRYGTRLINRDWFDVVAGGAPTSPPAAPPAPLPPSAPLAGLPALRAINAHVTLLRFFESGRGSTQPSDRRYATSFSARESRYINVELTLSHTAPGRLLTATIYCRYVRDGAALVGRAEVSLSIQANWTYTITTGGWGSDNANWRTGNYAVTCDDGQQTIAQGSFGVN